MSAHAILYSFRRCPYAMRARLALAHHGRDVILREVSLKAKPSHMLDISPKGTVPVLLTPEGLVIQESIEIMSWAMGDDAHVLTHEPNAQHALIARLDEEFKLALDRYKYHVRHPEHSRAHYQSEALEFIDTLELRLATSTHLFADAPQFADLASMPFVRQFAMVDRDWFFDHPDYPHTQRWLTGWLESPLFKRIMHKYTLWAPGDSPTLFLDA